MGNWYTNVSLHGTNQSDVVAALEELGRRAYVTPERQGWLVVYDRECDKFDLHTLESLALTLSTRLSCTALASFNADDDILWLAAWENGALATRYASSRKEFEDAHEFPALQDAAQVLARIFQKPQASRRVLRTLRKSHGVLGLLGFFFKIRLAYLLEIQRHLDLSDLLGIPRASVGVGFRYVDRGETPENIDRTELRLTLGS